jgi:hypothetical protein
MATYARKNFVVQDDEGNVVDGAQITVRKEIPGAPLAVLKASRDGATPLANPYTAPDGADAGFFVAAGAYRIDASWNDGTGIQTRTVRYEDIGNQGFAYTQVISPEDAAFAGGAVGDGVEDCTAAFQAMAAFIQSSAFGGVTVECAPAAQYLIWPDGTTPGTLLDFEGISGLTWRSNGSKFITDQDFVGAYGVFYFHDGCSDIRIDGTSYEETGPHVVSATKGGRLITIHDTEAPWSNNFLFTNIRQRGGSGFLTVSCDPSAGGGYSNGITIIGADIEDVYYGINTQANGDNLFVRGFRYSNVNRAYFPYNVAHHDVEIIGDGGGLSQIFIECTPYPKMLPAKRRTSDIKVRYRNVPPTVAAGGNLCAILFAQVVAPMTVSAIASNGSGGSRLTVNSSANATTGEVWFFNVTGTTGINGEQTITVIDSTHVDVSVAFVGTGIGYASVPGALDDIDLHMHCENASGVTGNPIFTAAKVAFGGAADTSLRGYEVSMKLSGYVSGYNNASVPCVQLFSDASVGTWTGESIRNVTVEDFIVEGGPNCALNFNCGVVANMTFRNVYGSSGTTWTFTNPSNAHFDNVDVPNFKCGLAIGGLDPYPTLKSKLLAFNSGASSAVAGGQSLSNGYALIWNYSATASAAFLALASFGYSNGLKIDFNQVDINSLSSGTTNIYSGGAAPVGSGAYVRKTYVDDLVNGLDWKPSVACATTANITLSGEQTIDGVLTSASRVLVKNQSTGSQNGIYVSASGAWTRAVDMDSAAEFPNAAVFVEGGTTLADTQWTCTNNSVTVGSTAVTFAQVSGPGAYSAGTGITLTGTQFAADTAVVATLTALQTAIDNLGLAIPVVNGKFVATVSSNALTVALKTLAGADPSASDPVYCYFRNATLTDGAPVKRSITAALSLTVPSTATMGFTNGVPGRLWVTLIDTGSGVVIGLENCSDANVIYPLAESGLVSTTIMNTSSDNAGVMYSAAAQTSKPFRIAGFLTWETALGTAGTWSAAPDVNQLFGPGIRKPGDTVQVRRSTSSSPTSNATTTYAPTGLTDSITPNSAVNKVKASAAIILDNGGGVVNSQARGRIFRGSTQIGSEAQNYGSTTAENIISCSLLALDSPATTSSTTYTVNVKAVAANTIFFNTNSLQTEMLLEELMG